MRFKISDDTRYVRKTKAKLCLQFNKYKNKHHLLKKENRMDHRSVFIPTLFKIATEVMMTGK